MVAVLIFVAVGLVYVGLTVTGGYCAVQSGRLVERALGHAPPSNDTTGVVSAVLKTILLLWLGGLVALTTGGVPKTVARGAEGYLNTPGISGSDRLKIRHAIRDYKRRNGLL